VRRWGLLEEPSPQDRQLLCGQVTPLARLQALQRQRADGDAHQAQRGMPDRCRHVPNLAFAALTQHDAQPACGDRLAMADRRRARGQLWLMRQQLHLSRGSDLALDFHAGAQTRQCRRVGHALGLDEIGLGQHVIWMGQAMRQRPVIGQQQQALTVKVEPTGSVDVRHRNVRA
jgi:predicted deacylase